jgi:predicted metal-dependent hydrolase
MPSTHRIIVARIDVDVQRKGIRNLHVGVYLPAGRVRVAAPLRLDDDAVRLAIVSRIGWIRRQQAAFVQQVQQTPRE